VDALCSDSLWLRSRRSKAVILRVGARNFYRRCAKTARRDRARSANGRLLQRIPGQTSGRQRPLDRGQRRSPEGWQRPRRLGVRCPASITRSASAKRSKPGCRRSTKLWKRVLPSFAKRRARWRCSIAPARPSPRSSVWSGSFRPLPTPRLTSPGLNLAPSFTMSSTRTAKPIRRTRFRARRAKLLPTSRCRATRPYSIRPFAARARGPCGRHPYRSSLRAEPTL
jgi:hypothetical protein